MECLVAKLSQPTDEKNSLGNLQLSSEDLYPNPGHLKLIVKHCVQILKFSVSGYSRQCAPWINLGLLSIDFHIVKN